MAWDDEKEVAPGTEEGELTPEEWNEHVADQKSHSTRHESNGDDELSVDGLSGDLADEQDAKPHDIGGATHTADTLANLNSKVSDATLDDTNDPREPEAHAATHEGGSDSLNVFDLTGDLVGQGLERVNDTLQVLSSIWDGTNVVADVDNTNTTTQSLEAESVSTDQLNTPPTGGILLLDQDQTIAADTITAIDWDSEETKGDVSSLLDNGSISIPSGYSFAKFSFRVRFSGSREPDVLRFQKNGDNFDGCAYTSGEGLGFSTRIPPTLETPFVSVSENDTIEAEIRVPTEVDIQKTERITHCEVLLL